MPCRIEIFHKISVRHGIIRLLSPCRVVLKPIRHSPYRAVQWTAQYGKHPWGAIVQPCWKLVCLQSCRVVSKWWYFCSSPQMKYLSFSFRKQLHLLRKPLRRSVEKIFLFFASVRVYNTIRLSKPPSVITSYWNIFCSGARLKKYLRFDTTRHDVCLGGNQYSLTTLYI